MTKEQLQALIQIALFEGDQSLWGQYCALFSNLLDNAELSVGVTESLKEIASRLASDAYEGASRCGMLKRDLERLDLKQRARGLK